MTATLHRLPVADNRLGAMAAAPEDAMALVELAIKRAARLERLVRKAAPAPEVTAAAEAVTALSGALANLKLVGNVLAAAYRCGRVEEAAARADAPAPRPPLRALSGGKGGTSPEVTR